MTIDNSTNRQNNEEELCQIAKAFTLYVDDLKETLEIMQSSFCTAIDQSSLTPKEKQVIKHIVTRVSPVGLRSLLEQIELTAQRTRLLYVSSYKQAATNLAATIYQQSGVAGPTGERTFTNRKDAYKAEIKEQYQPDTLPGSPANAVMNHRPSTETVERPRTVPAKREVPTKNLEVKGKVVDTLTEKRVSTPHKPRTKESSENNSSIARYQKYLGKYPTLRQLSKTPTKPLSGVHEWVQACGYTMVDGDTARATLDKGLDALLWPGEDDEVNAVQNVQTMPHPSEMGRVYILTMSNPTTGNEGEHLRHATWTPRQYPMHIIVEISEKASRESPFDKKRKGWEQVELYLELEYHNAKSSSPINDISSTTIPR